MDTTLDGRDLLLACSSCAAMFRDWLANGFLGAKGAVVPLTDAELVRYSWYF